MKIGINATAAFKEKRTGVEEYVYRMLRAMTQLEAAGSHKFVLYKDKRDQGRLDFDLPKNFKIKEMWAPVAWTQTRLATEMGFRKPDVLFIPVHVLPRFAPKNSVVAIHGLEYEHFPEYYPKRFLRYIRMTTKDATRRASKIITVSQATKDDLVNFYKISPEKISVIYHGAPALESQNLNQNQNSATKGAAPYLLYLGRAELKKNILGILQAYEILKQRYKIPHKLILAGGRGFGYDQIEAKVKNLKFKINQLGFVSEQKKQQLLSGASTFLFPSFYEGFGLPILEAQSVGVPIVTSSASSMPEAAGKGAALVNPQNPEEIAKAVYKIISNQDYKNLLIQKGFDNVKRFSWERCASQTLKILLGH